MHSSPGPALICGSALCRDSPCLPLRAAGDSGGDRPNTHVEPRSYSHSVFTGLNVCFSPFPGPRFQPIDNLLYIKELGQVVNFKNFSVCSSAQFLISTDLSSLAKAQRGVFSSLLMG